MDYQTLMNRRGIENEIRQLERDIARKEAEANAATSVLSHSPRAPSGNSDKVAEIATDLAYLRGELKKRKAERDEIREYISTIENSDVRKALRLYFIKGMGWREVSSEFIASTRPYSMGGIYKKCLRFLKMEKK